MRLIALLSMLIALVSCSKEQKGRLDESTLISTTSQSEYPDLFDAILQKDSLLFQIGFNQIDTGQVSRLIATDFEFYHDEHGLTDTKEAFLVSINGLRTLPFKTWRVLDEASSKVYPMYRENSKVLYGAIQHGVHDFYQQLDGQKARKTNTAQFTHLWILEKEDWRLKRVLSYDHKVPK